MTATAIYLASKESEENCKKIPEEVAARITGVSVSTIVKIYKKYLNPIAGVLLPDDFRFIARNIITDYPHCKHERKASFFFLLGL